MVQCMMAWFGYKLKVVIENMCASCGGSYGGQAIVYLDIDGKERA